MKNSKHYSTLLIVLMSLQLLSGCSSSDNSPQYTEENPFPAYLHQTGFDESTIPYIDDNSNYEIGAKFIPEVNGKITSIIVKTPKEVSDLRVTIWDSQQSLPIQTFNVDVPNADVETTFDIADIQLDAGKEYAITMNTANYYFHHRENSETAPHPIMAGNISIIGGVSNYGPSQTLDSTHSEGGLFGDCFFNFAETP